MCVGFFRKEKLFPLQMHKQKSLRRLESLHNRLLLISVMLSVDGVQNILDARKITVINKSLLRHMREEALCFIHIFAE